ncbi:HipA protein [Marinobacter sp. ELB17]|nr:HipA protein [Marinobacter sp. ELB17]
MRLPQEDFCQTLGVALAIKYESDGGPGIKDGMKLLLGSQQARKDRELFFKAQILFWLLAAIDGHAKNFSLFIEPGSAYRMTPLYDVISAYPLIALGNVAPQKAKMTMSSSSGKGYFIPSRNSPPKARVNQWGFPRIVDPKPGEWTIKFLKTDTNSKKNVDLQLSIGLVPKYSAWIKAYETRIQVGQPTIIQMSLSTHGAENNIEGHTIEVFSKTNEKIDGLTVSNNMARPDGVRAYSRNGETIDTLRNKEMRAGESANFSFPITDITQQKFDARSILIERIERIERIELVDFDVESSAKLMLSMPINKTVTRNAEDIKPEGNGEFDTLGSTAPDNRDELH